MGGIVAINILAVDNTIDKYEFDDNDDKLELRKAVQKLSRTELFESNKLRK